MRGVSAWITWAVVTASCAATSADNIEDFTNVTPREVGVTPAKAKKDPHTGFIVAGANATSLIESLTQMNGCKIADLEADMRPGAASEVGSDAGFLGPHERLLDVLAADNQYVVDELKRTHQELAKHLFLVVAIGEKHPGKSFRYHGRRYQVNVTYSRGFQKSPFKDGTKTNADATIDNLDNGTSLHLSMLVPHMIERYGFYEGRGTAYRVEPKTVVELFDFLKK